MVTFIDAFAWTDVPDAASGRRRTRITMDLNMDAILDYVLHGAEATEPWPLTVIMEMVGSIEEWARRENVLAEVIQRRERLSR